MIFLLLILLIFPDSGPGVLRLAIMMVAPPSLGLLALAVRGVRRRRRRRLLVHAPRIA